MLTFLPLCDAINYLPVICQVLYAVDTNLVSISAALIVLAVNVP